MVVSDSVRKTALNFGLKSLKSQTPWHSETQELALLTDVSWINCCSADDSFLSRLVVQSGYVSFSGAIFLYRYATVRADMWGWGMLEVMCMSPGWPPRYPWMFPEPGGPRQPCVQLFLRPRSMACLASGKPCGKSSTRRPISPGCLSQLLVALRWDKNWTQRVVESFVGVIRKFTLPPPPRQSVSTALSHVH